jgi:transcriptional regulator with GAF, ATPase, and Fis domain
MRHGVLVSSEKTTLRGTDEAVDETGKAPLRLEVVRSPDARAVGATVGLEQADPALLGRSVPDGLTIDDPRLSRLHLTVAWDGPRGGFSYRDMGSANGTFVNGFRAETGLLLPGDVVRIGDTLLVAVQTDLMAVARERAQRAARSTLPLLIRGETGCGKELLARAVHEAGERVGPFVAVNCAALPADLAATELFGHTKGAFSGAVAPRAGLFRAADAGSLLLDEIGDLPLELQGHLLRVLQEGKLRPVGSDREVPIDVRVMAATHIDLDEAVRSGRFRADLLARLTQLVVSVPPLRDRRLEILPLVEQFAPGLALTANAAEALLIGDWPGNVRALKALVGGVLVMGARDTTVRARDLVDTLPSAARVFAREATPAERSSTVVDRRKRLAEALTRHDGNITRVAEELGKPRAQIYRWLRTFGLSREKR